MGYLVAQFRVNYPNQRLALAIGQQIFTNTVREESHHLFAGISGVWGDDDVLCIPQGVTIRQRLGIGDVQGDARHLPSVLGGEPLGDLDLINGRYLNNWGARLRYSKKNLGPRWMVEGPGSGWAVIATL